MVSGAVEPTGRPADPSPSAAPEPTVTPKQGGGPDAPKTGEHSSWLSRLFDRFLPGGSSYGLNAWALLNLICVYVTLYILFPFHRIRDKFGRIDKMRKLNESKKSLWNAAGLTPAQLAEREEIMAIARSKHGHKANAEVTEAEFAKAVETRYYRVNRFARKFRLGIAIEAVLAAVSVLTFFNTENMRLPMILIDKWTPLMLLLAATVFVADLALTRYRENGAEESERA